MSSHVHDCPTEGCSGYWECLADPCDEEQKSPCHECLRAEVKHLRSIMPPSARGEGIVGEGSWAVFAEKVVAERDHFKAMLRERADSLLDARAEVERLKLACNAYWHDLERIASLCGRTADEYPLKAVERTVRQFAEARAEFTDLMADYQDLGRHVAAIADERDRLREQLASLDRVSLTP